jgi:hypothetical protein
MFYLLNKPDFHITFIILSSVIMFFSLIISLPHFVIILRNFHALFAKEINLSTVILNNSFNDYSIHICDIVTFPLLLYKMVHTFLFKRRRMYKCMDFFVLLHFL